MIHKVHHNKSNEIIVPYCAIEDNIKFMQHDGNKIEFLDGTKMDVTHKKEIHILEREDLIKNIYGQQHNQYTILNGWYSIFGDKLMSLWFVWIKCK